MSQFPFFCKILDSSIYKLYLLPNALCIYLLKKKKKNSIEIGYRFGPNHHSLKIHSIANSKEFYKTSWRTWMQIYPINRSSNKSVKLQASDSSFPPIGYRRMEVKKCSWWGGVNGPIISCLTHRACSKIENVCLFEWIGALPSARNREIFYCSISICSCEFCFTLRGQCIYIVYAKYEPSMRIVYTMEIKQSIITYTCVLISCNLVVRSIETVVG